MDPPKPPDPGPRGPRNGPNPGRSGAPKPPDLARIRADLGVRNPPIWARKVTKFGPNFALFLTPWTPPFKWARRGVPPLRTGGSRARTRIRGLGGGPRTPGSGPRSGGPEPPDRGVRRPQIGGSGGSGGGGSEGVPNFRVGGDRPARPAVGAPIPIRGDRGVWGRRVRSDSSDSDERDASDRRGLIAQKSVVVDFFAGSCYDLQRSLWNRVIHSSDN